jgi:hypothetical protein
MMAGMSIEPVTGKEWLELSSEARAATPVLACKGCGRTKAAITDERRESLVPAEHCWACPPWPCEDCGEMNSPTSKCSCFIDA